MKVTWRNFAKFVFQNLNSNLNLIIAIIMNVLGIGIGLLLPVIVGKIVSSNILKQPILTQPMVWIGFGCLIITYLLQGMSRYILGYESAKLVQNLRDRVWTHILKLSLIDIRKFSSGEVSSRIINDISTLAEAFSV